jgi:hypothetical protein
VQRDRRERVSHHVVDLAGDSQTLLGDDLPRLGGPQLLELTRVVLELHGIAALPAGAEPDQG